MHNLWDVLAKLQHQICPKNSLHLTIRFFWSCYEQYSITLHDTTQQNFWFFLEKSALLHILSEYVWEVRLRHWSDLHIDWNQCLLYYNETDTQEYEKDTVGKKEKKSKRERDSDQTLVIGRQIRTGSAETHVSTNVFFSYGDSSRRRCMKKAQPKRFSNINCTPDRTNSV